MLKLKKIPKKFKTIIFKDGKLQDLEVAIKDCQPQRVLYLKGVRIFIIGIREDKVDIMNNVPFGDPVIWTDVLQEWL